MVVVGRAGQSCGARSGAPALSAHPGPTTNIAARPSRDGHNRSLLACAPAWMSRPPWRLGAVPVLAAGLGETTAEHVADGEC
jgi:hypothetical protein